MAILNEKLDPMKRNMSPIISHLCFVDDLLFFCKANRNSCKCVKEVLETFHIDILHMEEGSLPIKYLGMPLSSSYITTKDCKVLDKFKIKLKGRKNKILSFAGRVELIKLMFHGTIMYCSNPLIFL